MLDRDSWLFINTFADWFSALGTIGAVVVALYLARKDARITLKVVAGLRLLIQQGVDDRPEYFSLEITNVGRRPARITNILMRDGVRFGWKRFRFGTLAVMMSPKNPLSANVPTTIADGERADYLVPWTDFDRANHDLFRELFAGPLGRVRARFFRMGVITSAGGIFDARIEKGLADRLAEAARRAR